MLYITAKYSADRAVFIGGQKAGRTNKLLPVEPGFHVVSIDDPRAIPHEAKVTGGTAVDPTIVEFTAS